MLSYAIRKSLIRFVQNSQPFAVMKNYFKKIIPERSKLESNAMLRPIAHWLVNPKIWHLNRRSIASGIAIGFFFGSLPIIGQMLLAAVMAIVLRVNMPIAVLSTLISNPVSMPFFYTANYYFGTWLMGRDAVDLGLITWTPEGLLKLGGEILVPLYFGSIVVGVILSALSFAVIRVWWRLHIIFAHKARRNGVNLKSTK